MLPLRGLNRRKAFALAVAASLIAVGAPRAFATPSAPASRYASIVLDADTGAVLYERNADLPRFPASLTKIMTLYLAFEAIAANKLSLTEQITVSAHAAGRDPSRLDLAPGSRLKVEEAIRAMTTKSANDAACAVAEHLGKGSEARFAQAMTAKAKALGLTHTKFVNASGLPEDGQVSSARDLALLSKALIQTFPEQYRYFSMGTFEFKGTRYPNQNRFLRTYYGADGIKTGFVNASGHNLAASAVRGGKRLIAIVLGGDTQGWTREHTMRLLDVSYAKVDPSLVMVASNAPAAATTPAATPTATAATPTATAPAATATSGSVVPAAAPAVAAAPTAPAATYATPAGAVTVTSAPAPSVPLPNATANLAAYAAAASAPKVPAGSVPAPAPATSKPAAASTTTAAASATTASDAAPKPAAAAATSSPPAPSPAQPPKQKPEPDTAIVAHAADRPAAAKKPAPAPIPATEAAPAAAPATSPTPPAAKAEPTAAAEPVTDGQSVVTNGPGGDWSVQVGLYRDATVARRRGEEARQRMPLQLRGADLVVGRALDGVHVTSRISRLSEQDARAACNELQRGRVPCVVVPPGRPLVVATN